MKEFIIKYVEDVFILGGALVIIAATFLLSKIACLYLVGFALVGLGVHFALHPPKERR